MANPSQSTSDFKGDHLSVKMFGAVDDWDIATETGTDNTAAIQAALDSLQAGQTLLFPTTHSSGGTGRYLITAPLVIPRGAAGAKGITLRGADPQHCQVVYVGTAIEPCVINMIGSDSVSWKDISIIAWSDNPAFMPKTVLMLGRYPDTNAYGHHEFNNLSLNGNVSIACVYSIASEENTWEGCNLFVNNGKNEAGTAKTIFYTSNDDDLGICDPAITPESNLDNWFSHCHFLNFADGDSGNVCVHEQMYAGAGDHVYRDCYMSPSKRGDELGWAFRFVCDPVNPYSGSNYVAHAIRVENAEGFARLEKGVGPGIMTGLRIRDNTLGVSAGQFIYGEDDCEVTESVFEGNFPVTPPNACNISIDKAARIIVNEFYDESFTVRTISSNSFYNFQSTATTLSLGTASFNNFVVLCDRVQMNGPIKLDGGNAFLNDPILALPSPSPIASATATNPAVLTKVAHGYLSGDAVEISGATGSWTPLNAVWAVTVVSPDTFSVPLNATGFGALAGVVLVALIERNVKIVFDATNGISLIFHYDSASVASYGGLVTADAAVPLSLLGDTVQLRASDGGGIAGQALTLLVNKNLATVFGRALMSAVALNLPTLVLKDASGATTSSGLEIQKNDGTVYFKVVGGSDASVPGAVICGGDVLPKTDNARDLGNAGLLWKKIWTHQLLIADLSASGPLLGASGNVGYGKIDLASAVHVENALAIANGGTGATSAASARSNLSVYSIADVDALIAGLQTQINGKATAGIQTGAASAGTPHTHTQLI